VDEIEALRAPLDEPEEVAVGSATLERGALRGLYSLHAA
jgi:hypothetical protein